MAAALQARGIGPGRPRRAARPDLARARHRDRGDVARGRDARRASRCRCGSARSRSSSHQTRRRIRTRTRRSSSSTRELAPFLVARARRPAGRRARRAARRAAGDAWERPADDPDALGIIQFTSGSTDDPKGVMLPQRCLRRTTSTPSSRAPGSAPSDRGVSWLPLYHDMGLIGLLMTPMITGLRPRDRAARRTSSPRRATGCAGCRSIAGTVTGGPNFAYALAARALRRLDGLDLSAWRMALNGAEPIDPAAVEAFSEAGAPPRPRLEAAVLRLRDGRGDARDLVPGPGHGHDRRHRRQRGARDRALRRARRPPAPTRAGSSLLGRTLRGLELRVVRPRAPGSALARPRGRRARAARQLGDARLLPTARRDRRDASTTAGCAPATSATSSTARSSSAAASRTSSSSAAATCTPRRSSGPRPASTACAPAT